MQELFLEYRNSFVASTSDFWWDPVCKTSFAACIGNFMAKRYSLKNGTSLFISDTTLKSESVRNLLRSMIPTLDHCQALIDFTLFDMTHSGDNIGEWLEDSHKAVLDASHQ